jgi:hypothetical protein
MNHTADIFTLPEQQLTPPENRLANDRADKFEWDVQKYMNTMDADDTALAIYENNPVNDGCLEILAMVLKGEIDQDRITVIAEYAKRIYAEAAVERLMGY